GGPMHPVRGTKPVAGAAALMLAGVAVAALGGCRGAGTATPAAEKRPAATSAAAGGHAGPRTAAPARPTRPCRTAELSVAAGGHSVKQGLDIERFDVTTAAGDGCTLTGAPNLRPKGPLS